MNNATLWFTAAVFFLVAGAASFVAGVAAGGAAFVTLALVTGLVGMSAQRQRSTPGNRP